MFPATPPNPPSPRAAREFSRYDPAAPGPRIVQPYAGWVRAYQRYIVVLGPLLGLIVLLGLGGLIVVWRRWGGAALLPWLAGVCLLLAPAAVSESSPRYLVGDLPPLGMAAALGVQQMADAGKRIRAGCRPSAA